MSKTCCSKYPHNCKRIIAVSCHREKTSSPSKVRKDLEKRHVENFVKWLNDSDARNTDIPVVIKSGEHIFVKTTVKADTKGFVIDLKELLHAHDWSGILYNGEDHNLTVF